MINISVDGNESGLPHPLPMPEFGGWFAPLTEFLPDPGLPIASFHRLVCITHCQHSQVSMH
jgi:hypothetical protein